ncbi:Molting carboxypeptidase A [Operophtera brumata]|uniref:Molting carboxypeptidase A n=1 Tax=Operophtera brumata TaxID=104452 RepID=A0A0L7LDK0_OPEBR|nr:Molting carboxypeptidase A [Operophtera brumata]
MNWKKYHRLRVIYAYIDDLERDYPAICTVTVIGKSVEGRDIKVNKLYIVPVLNPDGYEYTHTKDRMWRKNRACYGGQCVGVDLNRNFSYGWGHNGEEGSSNEPSNVFFRGPAPFSEPEAAAVRDTILGSSSTFKVFLSFHSYYELIIFPWGFKQDPCPNYLNLLEVGSTKDMTYFACGTSTDWSYGIAKIPYSYMIELRSRRHRFRLPKDQIIVTCLEIWNGVKSLMEFSLHGLEPLSPPGHDS